MLLLSQTERLKVYGPMRKLNIHYKK